MRRARAALAPTVICSSVDSQVLLDSVSAALIVPVRPAPAPAAEVSAMAPPRAAAPASPWPPIEEVNIEDEVVAPDDDNYGEFTIERGSAAGPASMDGSAPDLAGDTAGACPSPPPAVAPSEQAFVDSWCVPAGPCGSDSACGPAP